MGSLFGLKTEAWLDVWSVEHFFSGMSIGLVSMLLANRVFLRNAPFHTDHLEAYKPFYYVYILFLAYLWESIEFYLEAGYTHQEAITYWFQGVEFWGNRLITDPLLTLAGGMIGLQHAKFVWPARVFSLLWLAVHILVLPHSMALHQYL